LTAGIWKDEDVEKNGGVRTPPSVKAFWHLPTIDDGSGNNLFWDLKPVAKYDSDSNVWDSSKTDIDANNIEVIENDQEDLCAEYWVYGDTMVGCVKIVGNLRRMFKTIDPVPTDDLEWDYVKYQMHAMIAETDPAVAIKDVLKFDEKTVDFNKFNLQEAALFGLSSVGALMIGSVLSLLVF
jgi:uncharacterized protein YjfI (DUF2170 family)